MNKMKFLQWVVVGLFITNVLALVMLVKGGPKPAGPKAYIIESLNMDDAQIEAYDHAVSLHRRAVDENQRTMEKLRADLYQSLCHPSDSVSVAMLIDRIAVQQKKAEYVNYNHFLAIKHICNPEQMDEFEALTKEISKLFSAKR